MSKYKVGDWVLVMDCHGTRLSTQQIARTTNNEDIYVVGNSDFATNYSLGPTWNKKYLPYAIVRKVNEKRNYNELCNDIN